MACDFARPKKRAIFVDTAPTLLGHSRRRTTASLTPLAPIALTEASSFGISALMAGADIIWLFGFMSDDAQDNARAFSSRKMPASGLALFSCHCLADTARADGLR